MTAPLGFTETDRANEALAHIGEPAIVSIDDAGRKAARECRRHFASVRDQLLRKAKWQFAKASAMPAAIGAPADGVWQFRYPMPTDCLAVREIQDADLSSWEVRSADTAGDPRVMVDTDIEAPIVFYTRRIDNPAQWDELFAETFALSLAAKINPALGRDKTITVNLKSEVETRLIQARQKDAQERAAERITRSTSWIIARRGSRRQDLLKG